MRDATQCLLLDMNRSPRAYSAISRNIYTYRATNPRIKLDAPATVGPHGTTESSTQVNKLATHGKS